MKYIVSLNLANACRLTLCILNRINDPLQHLICLPSLSCDTSKDSLEAY